MIRDVRTVCYAAPDLTAGKAWYTRVLGTEPYFDEPFYVGFRVGAVEVGLIPDGTPGTGGVQVYWSVADTTAALAWLNGLGGTTHEGVTDTGGGITVASVRDPFGNLFGIIHVPGENGPV